METPNQIYSPVVCVTQHLGVALFYPRQSHVPLGVICIRICQIKVSSGHESATPGPRISWARL